MARPRPARVSITRAVCLTSRSVFLFISRTQIGKSISPQMWLQECGLPAERRAAGGVCRPEDPAPASVLGPERSPSQAPGQVPPGQVPPCIWAVLAFVWWTSRDASSVLDPTFLGTTHPVQKQPGLATWRVTVTWSGDLSCQLRPSEISLWPASYQVCDRPRRAELPAVSTLSFYL